MLKNIRDRNVSDDVINFDNMTSAESAKVAEILFGEPP